MKVVYAEFGGAGIARCCGCVQCLFMLIFEDIVVNILECSY